MTKKEINETMDSLKERFEHGAYCEACEQFARDCSEFPRMAESKKRAFLTVNGDYALEIVPGDKIAVCYGGNLPAYKGPRVDWARGETFASVDDLNNRCTVHYDAWLEENYQAMLADCED